MFSEDELIEAISRFTKHVQRPMPPSNITSCRVDSENGLLGTINHGAGGTSDVVKLDHSTVAAALIRFCIEKHIPIPRQSEKLVCADANRIALNFKIIQRP